MDTYSSMDCEEGKKMWSIRQESCMIGKSVCKSNREKYGSPVSSSSASSGMIRVIHIFAPKIIKTDVANFRELVQRLTGNRKRSRSGKKSTPPRAQQILSQFSDATKIFGSASRVEYSIPRSLDSYLSPPSTLYFHTQEEDIKPRIILRKRSCIDFSSSSSSDQSRCSPVSIPHFHGHQSQEQNSFNVDCNDSIANSTMKSNRNHHQRQKKVSTSAPIMVDPFQSFSGYREKLPPTPQWSCTSALPLFDEGSHLLLTNSHMGTLTGLVTPGPPRGVPNMTLPPDVNNSSDFTLQNSLLNSPNGLCRFSVQSPLVRGIQQMFENF